MERDMSDRIALVEERRAMGEEFVDSILNIQLKDQDNDIIIGVGLCVLSVGLMRCSKGIRDGMIDRLLLPMINRLKEKD